MSHHQAIQRAHDALNKLARRLTARITLVRITRRCHGQLYRQYSFKLAEVHLLQPIPRPRLQLQHLTDHRGGKPGTEQRAGVDSFYHGIITFDPRRYGSRLLPPAPGKRVIAAPLHTPGNIGLGFAMPDQDKPRNGRSHAGSFAHSPPLSGGPKVTASGFTSAGSAGVTPTPRCHGQPRPERPAGRLRSGPRRS